jgi:putative serine protease PepD
VRAQAVTPGSPLAAAGFKAGDVIIKLNSAPTDDLKTYSDELKKFDPGHKVSITYLEDGAEKTAEIQLAAR